MPPTPTATIVIELAISGPAAAEALDCIDNLLDVGAIQDEIHEYAADTGRKFVITQAEARRVEAAEPNAARAADRRILNELLDGAKAHGHASEPDQENGDLIALLHSCWERMTIAQREHVRTTNEDIAAWKEGG